MGEWFAVVTFVVGTVLGSLTTIAAFGSKVAVIRSDLTHLQDSMRELHKDFGQLSQKLER